MDPYKILDIERDATPDEIRRAYRNAARKHHPDMGGEAWIFQQIQEAYDSLVNPKPKKKRATGKAKPGSQGKQPERKSRAKPNSQSKSNRSNSQSGPSQKAQQSRTHKKSQQGKAKPKPQRSKSNAGSRNARTEQPSHGNRSTLPPDTFVDIDTGQNQRGRQRKAKGTNRNKTRASSILKLLQACLTLLALAAIAYHSKSYYYNTIANTVASSEDRTREPIAPAGEYKKLKERTAEQQIKERYRSYTNPAKAKKPRIINGVQWVTSFEQAKELSKKHRRPILALSTSNGKLPKKSSKSYTSLIGVADKLGKFICLTGDCVSWARIKRFNIIGGTTFLVLGLEEENIFRFRNPESSASLAVNLDRALENYEMYLVGEDWKPNSVARPTPEWEENQLVRRIQAPLGGMVRGIAQVGNELMLAQYQESSGMTGFLFRLDAQTGETITQTSLPRGSFITDICADEQFIYGVDFGWSAGDPIYILKRSSGKLVRKVVTKANAKNRGHSTKGIAYHDGKLFISSNLGISTVDPKDGRVLSSFRPKVSLSVRDFNGQSFLAGDYLGFEFLDRLGSQLESVNAPGKLASVAFHEENVICAYDQDYGFDKHHKRIRLWPEKVEIYTVRNPFPDLHSAPNSSEPERGK